MEIIELRLTRDDAYKLWSLVNEAMYAYERKRGELTYIEQRNYAFCITTYDILQSLIHRSQPSSPLYDLVEADGHLPKEKEPESVPALSSPQTATLPIKKGHRR